MNKNLTKESDNDISGFIRCTGQKNYANANKYLKNIVDNKLKLKIDKYKKEKLF